MIIYNPDIHLVIKTIQILNKDLDVEFVEDDIRASGAGLPASAAKAIFRQNYVICCYFQSQTKKFCKFL
jgi:hypothetical protein